MPKEKKSFFQVFLNGLITENPTFVLMLGMCPTLGITTAASSGIGMGLATTAVLVCSNLFISLLRNIILSSIAILTFPLMFDGSSLWFAMPIVEVAVLFVSVIFLKTTKCRTGTD